MKKRPFRASFLTQPSWTWKKSRLNGLFSLLNIRHPKKFKPFSHWPSKFPILVFFGGWAVSFREMLSYALWNLIFLSFKISDVFWFAWKSEGDNDHNLARMKLKWLKTFPKFSGDLVKITTNHQVPRTGVPSPQTSSTSVERRPLWTASDHFLLQRFFVPSLHLVVFVKETDSKSRKPEDLGEGKLPSPEKWTNVPWKGTHFFQRKWIIVQSHHFFQKIHPRSLTARPWKMLVGRLLPYWVSVTFQG